MLRLLFQTAINKCFKNCLFYFKIVVIQNKLLIVNYKFVRNDAQFLRIENESSNFSIFFQFIKQKLIFYFKNAYSFSEIEYYHTINHILNFKSI